MKRKTVKYRLTGTVDKLTIKVVDILGKEYTIEREGWIRLYYYPEVHYEIRDQDFDSLQEVLLEEGIEVEKDTWARLARVTLVSTAKVETTEVVERDYFFFKPKVKHIERLKCEEVLDASLISTHA